MFVIIIRAYLSVRTYIRSMVARAVAEGETKLVHYVVYANAFRYARSPSRHDTYGTTEPCKYIHYVLWLLIYCT